MLIKYGKLGQETREYAIEDGWTISDFLESQDLVIRSDKGDTLYRIRDGYKEVLDMDNMDSSEGELVNGDLYVYEKVSLSKLDESILDEISNFDDLGIVNEFSIPEQKKLCDAIVAAVKKECGWD